MMKKRVILFVFVLWFVGIPFPGWTQEPSSEPPDITYALVPGQEAIPVEQKVIQQATTTTKTFTVQDIYQQLGQVEQELIRLLQIRESLRQLLIITQERLGLTKITIPPAIEFQPPLLRQVQEDKEG